MRSGCSYGPFHTTSTLGFLATPLTTVMRSNGSQFAPSFSHTIT